MWRKIIQLSAMARALILMATMLVVALLMAPLAWSRSGTDGLIAEAVAAALALTGALAALVAFARFSRPDQLLFAVAAGTLLRTALPLLGGVGLYLSQPRLAAAGLLVYLVVFYLPALGLETAMLAAQASAVEASPRAHLRCANNGRG